MRGFGVALKYKFAQNIVENIFISGCVHVVGYSNMMCSGIAEAFRYEFFTVINNGSLINEKFCSLNFMMYQNFKVIIPEPKTTPTITILPTLTSPNIKILHLSDIHLDMDYKNGTPITCYESVCCHNDSTPKGKNQQLSNEIGQYNCDTSPWIFKSLFVYLAKTDFDLIYYTGDSAPRIIWNTNNSETAGVIRTVYDTFKEYLPNATMYSCLGNHDVCPVNSFPSQKIKNLSSNEWLYELFNEMQGHYISNDSNTEIKAGYYTTMIYEKLRIISLNTNFCDKVNLWMILDNVDPFNQFSWLISTLLDAERNNEKVHIIGHHSPGDPDCNSIWVSNLNRILSRFSKIITGIFVGHKHYNLIQILNSEKSNSEDVDLIYIAPSISPSGGVNPGFNIYEVSNSSNNSFNVLNSTTYYLNISNDKPEWEKLCSLPLDFDIKDLSRVSLIKLIDNMWKDDMLYKKFLEYYYRRKGHETSENRYEFLCKMLTSVNSDQRACQRLK